MTIKTVILLLLQVEGLKQEMAVVSGEVQAQEEGYKRLKKVDRKLSSNGGCRREDIPSLVEEVKNMQRSLFLKEQEKQELVQALLRLKDNLSITNSHEVRIILFCISFVWTPAALRIRHG